MSRLLRLPGCPAPAPARDARVHPLLPGSAPRARSALGLLLLVLLTLAALATAGGAALAAETIQIGSKRFTESYVLADIAQRLMEQAGYRVDHHQGMGGTIVLWQALDGGAIQMYPEYTGTIGEEILKSARPMTEEAIRAALRADGVGMTADLGFNNTYALVMRRERAAKLGIHTISDLRSHPDLIVGVTPEFLGRRDGWQPLAARYGLHMSDVRGVEHALGYAGLMSGSIDVKDAYSTDAKIAEDDLVVLDDDLRFFPSYRAVFLYRLDAPAGAVAAVRKMEGTLDERRMTELNAEAEKTKDYARAAALYFANRPGGAAAAYQAESLASNLARWTLRHMELVTISLLIAIAVGVPLGIVAARPGALSQVILGGVGIIQTIPSLALLALLVAVPGLGIKPITAVIALFLYSLLPIVRNTATGLQEIPPSLRESAEVLGLPPAARLQKVYLPMASRTILAGIKTSAVINVGTATLAALIGAGGLGEPILSGLNLNDKGTILEGAIPAALLAIVVQALFDLLDRWAIPRGLRLSDTRS